MPVLGNYLERDQTLNEDPFTAVLEVKSSREMIQVSLKCRGKRLIIVRMMIMRLKGMIVLSGFVCSKLFSGL